MLFLQVLVCKVCYSCKFLSVKYVVPSRFGLSNVLFLQLLVCEVCYSFMFWSVRCVIPPGFGLRSVFFPAGFGL